MTKAIHGDGVRLDASDGGWCFQSNCPLCGGGWVVEGASRGREAIPKCTEVKQAVYCPDCRLRMVIEVRLSLVTPPRTGARGI